MGSTTSGTSTAATAMCLSCGLRMPPNDRTYFDNLPQEVALVRGWIQNGAPNN